MMQDKTNDTMRERTKVNTSSEPTVRANVQEELERLRDELNRIAHDVRMKSKGASAEIQDTRAMLEREANRFGTEVEEAVERTQQDLVNAGEDLRRRFQKLANHIVLPTN